MKCMSRNKKGAHFCRYRIELQPQVNFDIVLLFYFVSFFSFFLFFSIFNSLLSFEEKRSKKRSTMVEEQKTRNQHQVSVTLKLDKGHPRAFPFYSPPLFYDEELQNCGVVSKEIESNSRTENTKANTFISMQAVCLRVMAQGRE